MLSIYILQLIQSHSFNIILEVLAKFTAIIYITEFFIVHPFFYFQHQLLFFLSRLSLEVNGFSGLGMPGVGVF